MLLFQNIFGKVKDSVVNAETWTMAPFFSGLVAERQSYPENKDEKNVVVQKGPLEERIPNWKRHQFLN